MEKMFPITDATLENTPALISLWGPSGSGKTYSALLISRGLVGPNGKIGLIDTENRRAKFYANLAGGWRHLDLQPPFSPERYDAAFHALLDDGCGCVIVDSMSHIWEGEGGVIDMAEAQTTTGLQKWNKPKTAYKKTMNDFLRSPVHMIFTLRAKRRFLQIGKGRDAKVEESGLAPICGDRFVHEMTASFLMGPDCKPVFPGPDAPYLSDPLTPCIKITDGMRHIVKPGEYLGTHTGEAVAAYLGAGATVNHDAEAALRTAREVASLGGEALEKHWKQVDPKTRGVLLANRAELRQIADKADAENAARDEGNAPMFDQPKESTNA